MMLRALSIVSGAAAAAGLWYGYMNLNLLRGTELFDFRYVVFAVASFLGLSAIEWLLGWIKARFQASDADT